MSRIVLVIEDSGTRNTEVLAAVRRNFWMSLADIKKSIAEQGPLFNKPLFDRSDPSFPERLLAVFEELDGLGVSYSARQVLDGQEYSPLDRYYEVDAIRLKNLIQTHAGLLEEQRVDSEFEAGD